MDKIDFLYANWHSYSIVEINKWDFKKYLN